MNKNQWKRFEVGQSVAWRESALFGGRVHIGSVVSVEVAPNGYPVTTVTFPTYKNGQPREWDVSFLVTPDQYEDTPSYWVC